MACMRDGFEQGKLLDKRFITTSPLNHGSFGMVFAARDTLTGGDVAIKCITKPSATENTACPATVAIDDRSEELAIHSKLPEHANIVNLVHNFETRDHQYMVLELCSNGDLYEAIRVGKGPLETEHVRAFMLELIDSIDHLHNNGVYHRDIKPENIFLTSSGSMKLGDFSLATTETWSTEFAVGSDRYMAPEQYDASVFGYGYSPAQADIWAVGIVLLNVLFQRIPFATPTLKDPLFADFANDRQSLFDIFPNMHQDTYNVIRHSLALDPANRSLGAVRDALKSVVSFTTDDESLDEFCTETPDGVQMVTKAREPLRTPSITTATATDSFPWSAALLKTPQKATRQLSTIRDEESDLFPGSQQSDSYKYVDTDESSLSSNLDSGLGMSFKSAKSFVLRPPSALVGSLPISFSRRHKTNTPYTTDGFSKSWSDLYDEDEELAQEGRSSFDAGMDISRVSTAKPSTPQLAAIIEDGRGSVTPRQSTVEPLGSGAATPQAPKAERPLLKERSSSLLDKWAVLGSFRRSKQAPEVVTPVVASPTPPQKSRYTDAFSNFTFGSAKKTKSPTRERSESWRQGNSLGPSRLRSSSSNSRNWERRESDNTAANAPAVPSVPETWALDNNWRDHKPRTMAMSTPACANGTKNTNSRHLDSTRKEHQDDHDLFALMAPRVAGEDSDDDDLELMVGGWGRDFHV
nr:hypothetical protein B0A51_15445 [Rachicladosporium sp. CCFEE 5018]